MIQNFVIESHELATHFLAHHFANFAIAFAFASSKFKYSFDNSWAIGCNGFVSFAVTSFRASFPFFYVMRCMET